MPVRTDITKKSQLDDLLETNNTIIMFTASWCGPCKMIKPVFDNLSNNKRTPLEFVKIDIDESPDICEYFDITSLPTFIKIENNKQVNKIVGCNTHELERIVNS